MQIHIVKQGDTVYQIARQYQVESDTIIYANQLIYPYALAVGQALLIQDGRERTGRTPLSVNGYAYPFISPFVLRETLPYLSDLSIFSYGFTSMGELLPPILDEQWMITDALSRNTAPILTLTPLGPDGRFSNQLIHEVINNPAVVQNLIQNLIDTMENKGYLGVDIDFEYILAEDRDTFTAFVSSVATALHPYGYQVSAALAPKTSANQPGLLYQGKNYHDIGAAADHVLLMTYEWGYTYNYT